MAENNSGITKEFLENSLKESIAKFVVTKGSSLGDGYMSVLYAVDVWKTGKENDEPLHLLVKGYPLDPGRQAILDGGGIFAIEVGMYDTVIPTLETFLRGKNAQDIKLPFAPFYGGKFLEPANRNGARDPLDSYLIMADLRKAGGFSLCDRFKGLDLDHFRLVMEGQAKVHAVSWAYKENTGRSLLESFPFLTIDGFKDMFEKGIYDSFFGGILKLKSLFNDDPRLQDGLDYLYKIVKPMSKIYYGIELHESDLHVTKDSALRNPGVAVPNEEPWSMLLDGDCWSNNLMFRYDAVTGKPAEVIFIDLQICYEGDQFTDINYSTYANTTQDLRKKHLSSLLHLYYDTFEQICKRLDAPLPPGWCWDEFYRRCHRAQIFGVYLCAAGLPMMLQNPNEVKDLNQVKVSKEDGKEDADEDMKKFWAEMANVNISNPVMEKRVRGVLEDAVEAGLI